nr:PREDICTED: uncharacterized protein LOC108203324 [Daucus carota subsp. sativus]
MADREASRLAKISKAMGTSSKSKRGTPIIINSSCSSLLDLINIMRDEYPSLAELGFYGYAADCSPSLAKAYHRLLNYPKAYSLVRAEPGDRTCHWDPQHLFVYKHALLAGLRFPLHPFIPKLLADVGLNPCQLTPNAWRIIHCFMVQCLSKGLSMSVSLFRKIFQFKNYPVGSTGWVLISHRPDQPHIFNNSSIPDNNPRWKKEFFKLHWEGGDWGTLFRSKFCKVVDGSVDSIHLSDVEKAAYAELVKDNGQSKCWDLLDEFNLRKLGLSRVSDEAATRINEQNAPLQEETGRMKRHRLAKDPRVPRELPAFLQPHSAEGGSSSQPRASKSEAFKPAWGFRRTDSVLGSTVHASDWSLHSITPADYQDVVLQSEIEGIDGFGSQALASANAQFQAALHQAKAWKKQAESHKKAKESLEEGMEALRIKDAEKDEIVAKTQSELVEARSELVEARKGKDAIIDDYMDSDEFKNLLEKHNETTSAEDYSNGWNEAVHFIHEDHPDLFHPKWDYLCPMRIVLDSPSPIEEEVEDLGVIEKHPAGESGSADSSEADSESDE